MAKAKRKKATPSVDPKKEAERAAARERMRQVRARNRKIDPKTGRPFENHAAKNGAKPKQDPKTGKFLPGNPTAFQPGQPRAGPGRIGGIPWAIAKQLRKQLAPDFMGILDPNDPNDRLVSEGVAARLCEIALSGGERNAIAAVTEMRAATEGTRIQHAKDDWKDELAALGLDPDEAMSRIEALIETMIAEADAKRMAGDVDGAGGA